MNEPSPTITRAREQAYREGYHQAKADMHREISGLLRLYSDTTERMPPPCRSCTRCALRRGPLAPPASGRAGSGRRYIQVSVLTHVRTVLRALSNRRVRRA